MPFTNWWPWDMTNSLPNKFAHTPSFRASPEGEGMGICCSQGRTLMLMVKVLEQGVYQIDFFFAISDQRQRQLCIRP